MAVGSDNSCVPRNAARRPVNPHYSAAIPTQPPHTHEADMNRVAATETPQTPTTATAARDQARPPEMRSAERAMLHVRPRQGPAESACDRLRPLIKFGFTHLALRDGAGAIGRWRGGAQRTRPRCQPFRGTLEGVGLPDGRPRGQGPPAGKIRNLARLVRTISLQSVPWHSPRPRSRATSPSLAARTPSMPATGTSSG
jgi:hypothetical protein